MPDTNSQVKIKPPRLIPSLVEGFNTVANHIYIIILPILLDLLLWFGPMIRIKDLVLPVVLNASELSAGAYGEESQAFIQNSKDIWAALLDQFNVLYGLRTYPIGIPSLLLNKGVRQNPLGSLSIIELQSTNKASWIILGLTFVGVIIGSLYFALIASATNEPGKSFKLSDLFKQTTQSFLLSLILMVALLVLSIPAICLISSIVLFLPSLGSFPLMVFGLVLVWVLLPLAFSPHGIFMGKMKAGTSIVNSIKLVRSLMSATGMFFLIVILLGYGLDILWTTPSEDSWMLLIGIFGHAFISSGLIAGSFMFYKNGTKWLQAVMHGMKTGNQKIIS
jgi:hypothetical protein